MANTPAKKKENLPPSDAANVIANGALIIIITNAITVFL